MNVRQQRSSHGVSSAASDMYKRKTSTSGSNVTISMTATNTANVAAGQYVYDIEYTQSDATTVERLAEGIVTVSPQSTK